jgi:hypothetical protein
VSVPEKKGVLHRLGITVQSTSASMNVNARANWLNVPISVIDLVGSWSATPQYHSDVWQRRNSLYAVFSTSLAHSATRQFADRSPYLGG